jgi:hypothetical protein
MTDWWSNASSLATGAGTLVLAVATFAAVRSSNRSARIAEIALQEQRRPVLVHSRLQDPEQRIMFGDGRWVSVPGGRAVAEVGEGNVYLALSLRNVGAGIAVLQGWHARPGRTRAEDERPPEDELRAQLRDLYVPGGDIGIWQGRLRGSDDAGYEEIRAAVQERSRFAIDLLYSDNVGAQRTISRFGISPGDNDDEWMTGVVRHWYLEGIAPR